MKPSDLTPEDSRYLDDVLPAAQARRVAHQIASDPQRADRMQAHRDAAAVWQDDAQRIAASVVGDPEGFADRVLALTAQGPSSKERRRRFASRLGLVSEGDGTLARYAAAALVLMAIGVGGTWMVRAHRATAHPTSMDAREADPSLALDDVAFDGLRRPVDQVKPRKGDGR